MLDVKGLLSSIPPASEEDYAMLALAVQDAMIGQRSVDRDMRIIADLAREVERLKAGDLIAKLETKVERLRAELAERLMPLTPIEHV